MHPYHFLQKPVTEADINKLFDEILEEIEDRHILYTIIGCDDTNYTVNVRDILYIESTDAKNKILTFNFADHLPNGSAFNTELNVNYNRIPINDYDLCVILGNLLDNCINACNNIGLAEKFIYVEICTTDEDRFIIRTKNPIYDKDNSKSSGYATPFEHGYGLKNIKNIVERNYGFVKCVEADDSFQVHILIPIIDNNKRVNPAIY